MRSKIGDARLDRGSDRALIWWAVAFAAVSVLVTGYRVYFHNQALQIPLIRMLGGTPYPNDPFAATLPYYASMVWRVVALAAKIIPLEPLLLVLFAAERVLVIYAAGNLALALAPKSRIATIAAMALFASDPVPIIGGGTLVLPYFEQTGLAIALLLMAMAAFYRRRPLAWAIWLGAAFECNSLYGVFALTYFTAAFAIDSEYRRDWRGWVRPMGVFAALAAPAIVLSMGTVGGGGSELWLAAARSRVPHHIFPSTWPAIKFARFAMLVLVTGLSALCVTRCAGLMAGVRRHLLVWAGVGVAWVLIAGAAEAIGSPSMLLFQPARATDLWYAFGAIGLLATYLATVRKSSVIALILLVIFHPTGAAGVLDHPLVGSPGQSMRQVCDWARTHTPDYAVFLVNPNWGEFRAMSARPAFVTWKDGSALLWHRPFARPWAERMRALGYDVSKGELPGERVNGILDRLYDSMSDDDALRLAARYGVRYWVVPASHTSSLPTVFRNRYWRVLNAAGRR